MSFVGRYRLLGIIAILVMLGGCATTDTYHLMATPVMYSDARLDFLPQLREDLRTTQASVFYATRRAPVAAGEPGHYSDDPDEATRFGVASVRLGEPGWTFDELHASGQMSSAEHPRPGRVEQIDEIGTVRSAPALTDTEREFIARINAHLARTRNPEVVLYVHGYRVTFDEVAVMMGSLSGYLGYGATVAFQWPTGQHFWNYLTDCPRAEQYIPDIAHLVELLSQTNAELINMLAYSCGSPLLAGALANLRARHPDEDRATLAKRYRIGNVIFAASDIDLKTFAREHVAPIMDLARQSIVYMSRRDAALGFSTLVAGASRIGRPDIEDLTVADIERLAADPRLHGIDVTDVRGAHEMGGMRGHGYWYANEWIATDVLLSLRYPIPPEKRCLVPVAPGRNIWRMRDDYPDCVAGELTKAYPQLQRGAK
jgi:esterase/lipase superfamily enzyme